MATREEEKSNGECFVQFSVLRLTKNRFKALCYRQGVPMYQAMGVLMSRAVKKKLSISQPAKKK